ncbi:MAG: thiolase domain-containing protein [Candidatus Altiarchaeota archaeon]
MVKDIAIIGVGMTKFGEFWDKGYRNLITEAGSKAIIDAKIDGKDIDAVYVGSMSPGRLIGQEHVGALVADYAGLVGIPATRVEAACASGGLALHQAYLAIKSGLYDIVVVGGVEKMTDVTTEHATVALAGAADQEWEVFHGITFPGLYAMMARRHMMDYGTTEEQISLVAVKNHANGKLNPYAQFQFEVNLEEVMNSSMVADPLRLLHCSPITDGAAAVILANEEKAKKICEKPVWIKGSALATDTLSLHERKSITRVEASINAGKKAYQMAGVKPKDIDFAEVHDCFTIAEILAVESLGFCKIGEGGKLTEDGETKIGGRIPVNTSGGLKAKGHPVGATGIAQAIEATWQLRGEAEKRQVKNAKIGLTQNVGGSGATCTVHIFSKEK